MIYTAQPLNREWVPELNRFVAFFPRSRFPARALPTPLFAPVIPPVTLPIDWTKEDTIDFPIDLNDQYGDCMYAAACHVDNTFTANNGKEYGFDVAALKASYLQLSGGDNGLDETAIIEEWSGRGLCGVADAKVFAHFDIDPTDAPLVQACQYLFGHVFFMLSVPTKWINNFKTGCVWDAPAQANPRNGHGVMWNGVDVHGRYKLQTWGTHCWITPGGVMACDPSAFVVASLRWFNSMGYAPNGKHYNELAGLWKQLGGNPWPDSPFPSPTPAPAPAPGPVPAPVQDAMSGTFQIGVYQVKWTATINDPPPLG